MLTADEFDQVCDVLIEHEGLIPWLYCDSRGFVTVGVGDKVSPKSVLTMPFVHMANSNAATSNEKMDAFVRVQNFYKKGLTASAYIAVSDLRLDAEFCRRRLLHRVKNEFVPGVAKRCPQFASFPLQAKLVLVDICYNVGVAGFGAFGELIAACNECRFVDAANEVHTAKEGEDSKDPATWGKRNTWRQQALLCACVEGWS